MQYAYSRKIPVQLGMSFGNENVMYEKRLEFNFGQNVYFRLGEVIAPESFADENAFTEHVKRRFVEYFDECYQMVPKGQLKKSRGKDE